MPAVTLRPMSADEFAELRRTLIVDYAADHVRAGNMDAATAEELAADELDSLLPDGLDTDGMVIRVSEDGDGRPVGYVWISLVHPRGAPSTAYIYDIVVDESRRGGGFGRALLAATEDEIRRHGLGAVSLNVFGDNATALGLYSSSGYRVTTQQMRKDLD